MKTFDNYEISPCTRTEEPGKPGHFYFEVCEPHEADVWTLYGHIDGEGVEAIGDFATREYAEEVFQRITGIKFAETGVVQARLRVTHAGARLLKALRAFVEQAEEDCLAEHRSRQFTKALEDARIEIAAAATGKEPT